MEDNLGNEKITVRKIMEAFLKAGKVFSIPAILLLPIIFVVAVFNIRNWSSDLGLLYMRPELPILITVLLFPLTWIYLALRGKPSTAKKFAAVTASILLVVLSVSIVMETVSTKPMADINRAFVVPEEWTSEKSHSDAYFNVGGGLLPCIPAVLSSGRYECPSIGRAWKMQRDQPFTREHLEGIAESNGFTDYTVSSQCGQIPNSHDSSMCELSGEIDGVAVSLSYIGSSHYESDSWGLYLKLKPVE